MITEDDFEQVTVEEAFDALANAKLLDVRGTAKFAFYEAEYQEGEWFWRIWVKLTPDWWGRVKAEIARFKIRHASTPVKPKVNWSKELIGVEAILLRWKVHRIANGVGCSIDSFLAELFSQNEKE